ncbi:MAG: CotH kinase family protein [Limisphaerales bacterium]
MKPKQSRPGRAGWVLGAGALVLSGIPGAPFAGFGVLLAVAALVFGLISLLLVLVRDRSPRGIGAPLAAMALGVVALTVAAVQQINVAKGHRRSFGRSPGLGVPELRQMARLDLQEGRDPERRPSMAGFSSSLPVVILSTEGRRVERDASTFVRLEIHDPGWKPEAGPVAPAFNGHSLIHYRGYSSLRLPKLSYTVHLVDAATNQVKASLLGLPKDDDWVLYAPFEDKTMLRDVLAFEMTRAMGRYAPRTRFVELFVNRTTGPVSMNDYEGVYILIEKIKRGAERVNIKKLEPDDQAEPAITGGYIVKRDHQDRDGARFRTRQGGPYFFVSPKDRLITREQRSWIAGYFQAFENALHGPEFADPRTGYAAYLDVDSMIDMHWLVEGTKNVDGFRYSAFLTKDREGKLQLGPPWDWNRSFGNADYYEGWETDGWYGENLRSTEISWHERLMQDPKYAARVSERWRELRKAVFDPPTLRNRIRQLAGELDGARQRNFKRWPILGRKVTCNYFVGRTYEDEIEWLSRWIEKRVAWIDHEIGPGDPPAGVPE